MYVRDLTVAMLGVILLFTISGQALPLGDQVDSADEPVGSVAHLLNHPGYYKVPRNRSEDDEEDLNPNPELGEFAEGDIVAFTSRKPRNGIKNEIYRWPENLVPYEISSDYKPHERDVILKAIGHFRRNTCIRFIERTNQKDYISIGPNYVGCFSAVGRIGGRQEINLAPNCLSRIGTPIHEIMHALGFLHEHSRHDRDKYITIHEENMDEDKRHNFFQANETQFTSYNVGYDFYSVMHYNLTDFSNNGQRTIQPIIEGSDNLDYKEIGQRKALSEHDILKIRRMYNCS